MKSKLILLITLFLMFTTSTFALEKRAISLTLLSSQQDATANIGKIRVRITNNTKKSVKVLKWDTPLENMLRADIFNVSIDNEKVSYVGIKTKRGAPTEDDYIVFQPKESKTINIDISNYYKMELSGTYSVSYKGSFKFLLLDDSKTFKNNRKVEFKKMKPTVESMNLEYVPVQKRSYEVKETTNYYNCSDNQIDDIKSAYASAIDLVTIASTDMNNAHRPTSGARYSKWFGSADSIRHDIVQAHFEKINSALASKAIQFNCAEAACQKNDFAYVNSNQPYIINLCNNFWNAPLTGTNSKAGTIIHETSHFAVVADTDSIVHTQADAQDLATDSPDNAINNANSYEYFAENTPTLDMRDGLETKAARGYSISGRVIDAATGLGIGNASLSISRNGHPRGSTHSDTNGRYTFENLAAGEYVIRISASRYIRDNAFVTVHSNVVKNINILKISRSNNYRIVLTWGAFPHDIDSHLFVANPNAKGCRDEVWYLDKNDLPYASLDVDDVTSYGPETVKITKFAPHKYHEYWIRDFNFHPGQLGKSQSVVKVYRGCRLIRTYRVPRNARTEYWHVFDISGAGIRTVNQFRTTRVGKCGLVGDVPRTPVRIRASDGRYNNFIFLNNYGVYGATKYKIYRTDSFAGSLVYLGATYNSSYRDTSAKLYKKYFYAIKACNSSGCSNLSGFDKGHRKRPPIPATPKRIEASDGKYYDFVYLSNYNVYGATKYKIYRRDSYNGALKYLGATRSRHYKDGNTKVGRLYYYTIKACNNTGCSALSSYNRGYRKNPAPATPRGLKASYGTYRDFIYLNNYSVYGATKYRIYRKDTYNGAFKFLGGIYSKTFKDRSAVAGRSYYYAIRACNNKACSALSNYSKGSRLK